MSRATPHRSGTALSTWLLRVFALALVLTAVGLLVYVLRFLIAPVVLGLLMSYFLRPLVNMVEDRGVPRGAAVLLWFGVLVSTCVVMAMVLWPSLEGWLSGAPGGSQKGAFELELQRRLEEWALMGNRAYPALDWQEVFFKARDALEQQRAAMMAALPAMALALLSNAGTLLLAPVIGLFLLLDGAGMRKAVVAWVPNRYFEPVLVTLHKVDRQIAAYLKGAASESALVTVLLSTVLAVAGMPSALLFGCIYGVLNVIPLAGPLMGAGAGVLFSLLDPAAPGVGTLLLCYGGVYVVDAAFINPLVVGKTLNLHPLTIILGISVGGSLGGVLGMLAVVPVVAISKAVASTIAAEVRHHARV